MPTPPRYLTKSRFKLGTECPRKLYYTAHPDEYANLQNHDEFLMALAEGGHQVGTLAQLYFPDGKLIETLAHDEAIEQTTHYSNTRTSSSTRRRSATATSSSESTCWSRKATVSS